MTKLAVSFLLGCSGAACLHALFVQPSLSGRDARYILLTTFFFSFLLCGSRNYPYYPHGRSLEIPRGRGDLKAKLLEGQYEAKLEFPGGCSVGGGSMDIFWN